MSLKLEFNYKKYLQTIYHYMKKVNIAYIVLFVLALHVFIMSTPSDGKIFDESAYIPASIDTIHGIAANAEHMPLAKLVIGATIQVFGDWWFSWRITSVLFSTLAIGVVYLIALQFMSRKYALFSAAFLGFDVLFFVNGSIGILDAQAAFFGLLGVWLLLKKRYAWSGLVFAVAILSKEITLLLVLGMAIYLLMNKVKQREIHFRKPTFKAFKPLLVFFLVLSTVFMGGLYAYDIVYKPSSSAVLQTNVAATVFVDNASNPVTTSYSTTNVTSHIYITNPIQHLVFAFNYYAGLTPTINPSTQDFRPPWSWALPLVNAWNPPTYYQVSVQVGSVISHPVSYYSQISYPVTVFIVPTVALCLWMMLKKNSDKFPLFYIGWVAATYGPWLLFGLLVQKMTFNYYFLYTVPALCMGAPWFISKLKLKNKYKTFILLSLLLIVGVYFMYYFPINIFRA
jgi:4-amino-4-deoxy-L-arabinose transferase-like glycosyltransferase